MDKDTAQSKRPQASEEPTDSGNDEDESPKTSSNNSAIPSVDLKAHLKIEEEQSDDLPKINYGEKLFFAGLIFCVSIIVCVIFISYFWIQNSNQAQKVITIQQANSK